MNKSEEILYRSNSKGSLVDIQINLANYETKLEQKDVLEASGGKNSSTSNYTTLPKKIDSKTPVENHPEKEVKTPSTAPKGKPRDKAQNTGVKILSPADKNEAFKLIRENIVLRHQEALCRPNFQIAGIGPVLHTDLVARDLNDRKFTKSNFEKINGNKSITPFKSTNEKQRSETKTNNSTPVSLKEFVLKNKKVSINNYENQSSISSNNNVLLLKRRTPNRPYSPGTTASSSLSTQNLNYLSRLNNKNEFIKEEDEAVKTSRTQDTPKSKLDTLYQEMQSILPKINREYDTDYKGFFNNKPSFQINYRQSGTRKEDLENTRFSFRKDLKIKVSAPKNWLKLKFLHNQAHQGLKSNYIIT